MAADKADIPFSEHADVDVGWFLRNFQKTVPLGQEDIWVNVIRRIENEKEWDAVLSALRFIQMKNRCAGW